MKWGIIVLKILNRIIFFTKVFLLLIDFVLTLYIMLMMNSVYQNEIVSLLFTCLPLFCVLIIFVISFFFKEGDNNTIFNISSLLALITILIIAYRTIFDQNMVMWIKSNMNFYYFRNQIKIIKILGYSIFIGNLLIIYHDKKLKKN